MPTVREIVAAIDRAYPLSRAESWDKVGLLIGDGKATVLRVLVAHEVTAPVIDEAQQVGANLLVVYHPPLFRPLDNLDFSNHSVQLAARCIAAGIHVVAVHTALDGAPLGHALGDKLAEQLGLIKVRVLKPSGRESLFKIAVFVPHEALDAVQNALWEAGAGQIGNYDHASFRVHGTGTFRPLEGANPHIGTVAQDENVAEWRLEVIVPSEKREAAVRAMIEAHPYEEVAYDVYPLHNTGSSWGAARIGELPAAISLNDYSGQVHEKLRAPGVRVVPAGKAEVKTVACVPGSGASYLRAAAQAGADAMVTGDIKHHDALQAQAHGLAIIDTTHTATEHAAVDMIAEALEAHREHWGIDIVRSAIDTNPFVAL